MNTTSTPIPSPHSPRILVVDDEAQALRSFSIALRTSGFSDVACCQDGRELLASGMEQPCALVLLDLTMPHVSGQEILARFVAERPEVPVIVITGANDAETAVECMKAGAFDYLVKPVERNRLVAAVRRALEVSDLRHENLRLKEHLLSDALRHPEVFAPFVTQNRAMKGVLHYAETIATTRQPVLITGETGVGKELMARSIHRASGREGGFVPVNVAGVDENVFSDTLFGHAKGAFTGADRPRAGLIERAAAGTLFLDEIGDLHPSSQIKLLRLLQESEYYPLGSDTPRRTDARVVVATNCDLESLMNEGRFRKDLFYRLQTHRVHIPALRERLDDLPLLLEHFLDEAARSLGKTPPTPPRELTDLLATHPFPGNVRELQSLVFEAVSLHRAKVLSLDVFRQRLFPEGKDPNGEPSRPPSGVGRPHPALTFFPALPTLREAADLVVEEALRRANGNQTVAARLLGITQQALSKRRSQKRGKKQP